MVGIRALEMELRKQARIQDVQRMWISFAGFAHVDLDPNSLTPADHQQHDMHVTMKRKSKRKSYTNYDDVGHLRALQATILRAFEMFAAHDEDTA